jgi:hypothetical protein
MIYESCSSSAGPIRRALSRARAREPTALAQNAHRGRAAAVRFGASSAAVLKAARSSAERQQWQQPHDHHHHKTVHGCSSRSHDCGPVGCRAWADGPAATAAAPLPEPPHASRRPPALGELGWRHGHGRFTKQRAWGRLLAGCCAVGGRWKLGKPLPAAGAASVSRSCRICAVGV